MDPSSKTIIAGEQRISAYVKCRRCKMRGPRFVLPPGNLTDDEKKRYRIMAAEAWNRRDHLKELVFSASAKMLDISKQAQKDKNMSEEEKAGIEYGIKQCVRILQDLSEQTQGGVNPKIG